MDTIKNNHVVEINYTLTDENGEVIDSTQKENPFAFIQGKQNLLPGLEMEIHGKRAGDSFKAVIPPEKAYGEHHQSLVQSLPLESFGADAKSIKVGDTFQIQSQDGQVMRVQAVDVNDQEITLDANHQLAGKILTFDVEIVSVREATADELAKGHLFQESSCCDSNSCC